MTRRTFVRRTAPRGDRRGGLPLARAPGGLRAPQSPLGPRRRRVAQREGSRTRARGSSCASGRSASAGSPSTTAPCRAASSTTGRSRGPSPCGSTRTASSPRARPPARSKTGSSTLSPRGRWAISSGAGRSERLLDRMFAYRHRVTADDLAAHAACREGEPMKVAITGASGLLGSALVPFLTTGGHEVVRLVRRAPRAKDEIRWDPEAGEIDAAALEGVGRGRAPRRREHRRGALDRGPQGAAALEPRGADRAPCPGARGPDEEAEGARVGLCDRLLREPRATRG